MTTDRLAAIRLAEALGLASAAAGAAAVPPPAANPAADPARADGTPATIRINWTLP